MENKTVRDTNTTFRHYFNDGHGNGKSNYRLLSLANTLKGTDYTDPNAIQINTLDGSFFSSLKNDISFLFDNRWMILLEHQSTINENMPIRLLGYVNEIYNLYLKPYRTQIYNKAPIQLPTPEFHVFYDGDDDTKDSDFDYKLLRLSDSFMMPGGQLESTVHCYNLNAGKSLNLKKLCKPWGLPNHSTINISLYYKSKLFITYILFANCTAATLMIVGRLFFRVTFMKDFIL